MSSRKPPPWYLRLRGHRADVKTSDVESLAASNSNGTLAGPNSYGASPIGTSTARTSPITTSTARTSPITISTARTSPITTFTAPTPHTSTALPSASTQPTIECVQGIHLMPLAQQNPALVSRYEATVKGKLDRQLDASFPDYATLTEFFITSATQPDLSCGSPSIIIWYEADKDNHKEALVRFRDKAKWLQKFLAQESVQCYILPGLPSKCSRFIGRGIGRSMHTATCAVLVPSGGSPWSGAPVDIETGRQQVFGGWLLVDGSVLLGLTTRHGFKYQGKPSPSPNDSQDSSGLKTLSYTTGVGAGLFARYRNHSWHQLGKYVVTSSAFPTEKAGELQIHRSSPNDSLSGTPGRFPATAYFREQSDVLKMNRGRLNTAWDWALLSLPQDIVPVQGFQPLGRITDQYLSKGEYTEFLPPSGAITLRTAENGLYHGTLSSSKASFRVQGSIHDVRLIILDRLLPTGTSGTWVDHDGYVCGIVVAARQDRPWAYMLPIGPVLDDIRAALRTTDVRIPLAEELASLSRNSSLKTSVGSLRITAPSISSSVGLASRSVPEHLREVMHRLRRTRGRKKHNQAKSQNGSSSVPFPESVTTSAPEVEQALPLPSMDSAQEDTTRPLPRLHPQSTKLGVVGRASGVQQVQTMRENAVRRSMAHESPVAPDRGRTVLRSRHLRPPSQRTQSRNSSESSIRTSDSHWDEILPERIRCRLELHLNSNELDPPAPPVSIPWLEKNPFSGIISAADDRLDKAKAQLQEDANSPDRDLPPPDHNLETGSCRIVGKRHATAPRKLDNEHQLVEVLIPGICGFISENPREKFELEIKWHYSTIFIRPEPSRAYKATIIDAIHSKLRANFRGQEYIPRSDLNRITSAMEARRLIDEDPTIKDKEALKRLIYPEAVEHKAERLLAVCIYALIDLSFLESLLLCSRFSDQNCPKRKNWPLPVNKAEFDRFLVYAPMFFAHKFGEEEKANPEEHANILDDVIVPINFDDHLNGRDFLGSGTFSEVYRAKIHPYHHVFSQDKTEAFALKRFVARPGQSDEKRREKFEQERHTLRMLKTYRHSQNDHVVTHHAAWTHQGAFFILFPLATCNLKRYMEILPDQDRLPNCRVPVVMPYAESSRTPDLNRKFALWILSQLAGLAEGIQRVHALARVGGSDGFTVPTSSAPDATGFHHDIKPDNILVFVDENERNDYGTFKIADFGSGRAEMLTRTGLYKSFRKTQEARVSPLMTDKSNGAPTYTAPDHYLTGKMSRASDMWSLGRVFLEILTWAFLPHQANSRSFSSERYAENMPRSGPSHFVDDRFWCVTSSEQTPGDAKNASKPSATINAAVLNQLAALERIYPEGQGTSPFGIVVKCTKRMLVVDRRHRIDAVTLGNALDAALFNAIVALRSQDDIGLREDTDPYPQTWQEPVAGSGPYVEPFPTPTTVPADPSNLPDLAHSSTNGNFLSHPSSHTKNREPSAAVSSAFVRLAGEFASALQPAPTIADDQPNEDKIHLDGGDTKTSTTGESSSKTESWDSHNTSRTSLHAYS